MKFAIALLLASTKAINIKSTPLAGHAPLQNTCVNVRKDTGIEEPCDTVGNSAWEPDAPLEDPLDKGWTKGFEGLYWFAKSPCNKEGCPTAGAPDFVTTNEFINFTSPAEFSAQTAGFPGERFAAQWFGKIAIYAAGEYEFSTKSDDGSRLSINGAKVVDNWGLHGAVEKTGTITLNKGYHDIKVEFFQNAGGASCVVKFKGEDTAETKS